jgi:hypothetical protein
MLRLKVKSFSIRRTSSYSLNCCETFNPKKGFIFSFHFRIFDVELIYSIDIRPMMLLKYPFQTKENQGSRNVQRLTKSINESNDEPTGRLVTKLRKMYNLNCSNGRKLYSKKQLHFIMDAQSYAILQTNLWNDIFTVSKWLAHKDIRTTRSMLNYWKENGSGQQNTVLSTEWRWSFQKTFSKDDFITWFQPEERKLEHAPHLLSIMMQERNIWSFSGIVLLFKRQFWHKVQNNYI